MNQDIIQLINERGVLLQKELFELVGQFNDVNIAKSLLDTLERACGQKMITVSSLVNKAQFVLTDINALPQDIKNRVETTLVTIGLTIEVQKIVPHKTEESKDSHYQVFYPSTKNTKKIEVVDFVGHFRSRYQQLQRILMQRPDIQNMVSINKLPRDRQRFSIIGIVTEKKITKNKNLSIVFEDLTGRVSALVRAESECFSKAAELQLDDVVAVKASGSQDLVFVHDIVYPDSFRERVRFDEDVCIAFTSDIHAGSVRHLGKEFQRFLDWLNSGDELAQKIRYLFIVGDNVDGVGIFPGQERLLTLKSLKDQYALLASYLQQVPQHITMFMCPGQHDSVRVAEPQPVIDNFYGAPLYNLPNLVLVPNPTLVKLFEKDKEFRVQMYHGASIHAFINEIEELRLLKAHKCPAKAAKHMLKRRHLAPSHGVSPSVVYVPNAQKDPLVITEVPDILCTGEVHRLDIENYNGTIIITGSCWQAQTEFEEKVGNIPDPCKIPVFNLKSRELKIVDFTS
jgi:DNA polymerase II small subunit